MQALGTTSHQISRVSIIIEWENVRLAELDRCRDMLRRLGEQTLELASLLISCDTTPPVEVIILFNRTEVDEAEVRHIVTSCIEVGNSNATFRLIPVDDLTYYEQKNFGALQAEGDLIVFLDSDVIPEDGWLVNLVEPFRSPAVSVVGGNCYIDPDTIVAKAFALFWFFPLREDQGRLLEKSYFFANNVAFRSNTFKQFTFPASRDVSRGACVQLADALRRANVTIYRNTNAQVSHPAPNGLKHFVFRGIAEGRDRWIQLRSAGTYNTKCVHAFQRFLKTLADDFHRIAKHRHQVGVSTIGTAVVAGIAGTYRATCLLGELLTCVGPNYMKSHFHV